MFSYIPLFLLYFFFIILGFPAIHGVFLVDATCENDDIDYLRNTIKHFVEE